MKILQIRFKNLNSLKGEWAVDFENPAYQADGIFAITGPTGSGKTTILDAICLGLFGQTPRLNKITTTNEIMTRQTGECFAEVTFETNQGRYRCHWSQHRARKKQDGALQKAKHEIVDATTDQVLDAKIKTVATKVESVTGMNFDRFTRSSMLAQGHFAAFLNAKPDERGPILEQITGTEVYSRISKAVHERTSGERDKLNKMSIALKALELLDEEEEKRLRKEVKEGTKQVDELKKIRDRANHEVAWLDKIHELERSLGENRKSRREFEQRKQDAAQKLMELEWAEKALLLEGDYRAVQILRNDQKKDLENLDRLNADLPKDAQKLSQIIQQAKTVEAQLNNAEEEQKSLVHTLKKVRQLDTQIDQMKTAIDEQEAILKRENQELAKQTQAIKDADEKLAKLKKFIATHQTYLTDHREDETLLRELTGIKHMFTALSNLNTGLIDTRNKVSAIEQERAVRDVEFQGSVTDRENATKAAFELQKKRDEIRHNLEDLLQDSDMTVIRDTLESTRDRLEKMRRSNEILKRIQEAENYFSELSQKKEEDRRKLDDLEKNLDDLNTKLKRQEEAVDQLEEKDRLLDRIRSLEDERQRLVKDKPCPLCGATEHPYATGTPDPEDETSKVLKTARADLAALMAQVDEKSDARLLCKSHMDQIEANLAEKQDAVARDEQSFEEAMQALELSYSRKTRFDDLARAIADSETQCDDLKATLAQAQAIQEADQKNSKLLEDAQARLSKNEKLEQEKRHILEKLAEDQKELENTIRQMESELGDQKKQAERIVAPYGIENLHPDRMESILDTLCQKEENWKKNRQELDVYVDQKHDLDSEKGKSQAAWDQLNKTIADRKEKQEQEIDAWESLRGERQERFGEKDADAEESRVSDAIASIKSTLEGKQQTIHNAEKEIERKEGTRANLIAAIEKRKSESRAAEKNLENGLKKKGFQDESHYSSSCLQQAERECRMALRDQLTKERTEIETKDKDLTTQLKAERSKRITDQDRLALKKAIQEKDEAIGFLQREIGAKNQQLKDNENQKEKLAEKTKQWEAQKKETERWDQLHQLIGSADGKKFRNIAQGITFDVMIGHANRQLQKMSDRYLLKRNDSEPLNLDVIDDYQAGEIRSTKNLSGGEQFIVSLALALGLSQMASRRVQVDSLFLDEGFGTLDDDALETALETLAGLHQGGKTIGVISHVGALKERIPTQIEVTPRHGGISQISGPGVRRL